MGIVCCGPCFCPRLLPSLSRTLLHELHGPPEKDWQKVARKYDLPLSLPHRHMNPKKPVGYDKAKVYEGGLREIVENKFRKDLVIWGYSYGSYLKGK